MHDSDTRLTDSRAVPPQPGADVVTIDDKRLGTVRGSSPREFQVHVRWGRDFWLSRELIRRHDPGRIVLNISRSVVGGYRHRRPTAVSELLADAGLPDQSTASEIGPRVAASASQLNAHRPAPGLQHPLAGQPSGSRQHSENTPPQE